MYSKETRFRAVSRRREFALRVALGASRSRVVRQLLTESLLLATAGGVFGATLAWWSFGFLQKLVPESLTISTNLRLDIKVLLFAFFISLATGVVFGLVPALQSAKVDINETLKQSSSRATSTGRLRSSMIVFEVSLSIVLLVGAGLLIQTLFHLFNQYSEMQPDKLLTMRTVLPRLTKYKEPAKRTAFYEQVLERVQPLALTFEYNWSPSFPPSVLKTHIARARSLLGQT
jgi:putative ABC transport system permease protein